MNKITRDFVSNEKREFTIRIGSTLASALSGFVAGAVASVIVFLVGYQIFIK